MQHVHGIIPFMFDCWANPVVHLLLLKSSMASLSIQWSYWVLARLSASLCMFVSVVPSLIYLLEISRSPFIYIRKYASGEQHDGPIHQLQFRLFCVHFTV